MWTRRETGLTCKVWWKWRRSGAKETRSRLPPATSSPATHPKPYLCWRRRGTTGASRIPCTGCWTSPSGRMKVVCARAMWPATWRSYDAWRTPCCVAIPRPEWASRTSGSSRDAIQLTWRESCSRSDFAVALGPSPSWPRPRSWSGPNRLRSSTSRRCPRCACVSSNSCGTPRTSRRCPGALNFLLPMARAMA